jgi:hypothetical protein
MTERARSWLRSFRGVGVSVMFVLGACGPGLPDQGAEPAGAERATREQAIRIPNSLTTQALVLNSLTTNYTANGLLGTSSLNQLFYPPGDSYINTQLRDPNARVLMNYLVGCALKTGQNLKWTNPATNQQEYWYGSMGLCPEWQTSVPSLGCLERVSACLLARNNAFGVRVELSARGEHPTKVEAYSLETVTHPSEYEPSSSARLTSYATCTSSALGMTRNCGWTADAIGGCTPGETVRLGAGAPSPDNCSGPALGSTTVGRIMVRVCSGIVGCDSNAARFLAQSEGSCGSTAPAVAFTCPAEGYFNVMTAPYNISLKAAGAVQVAEPDSYRLSEQAVFTVREGAYYGNIFEPDSLANEVHVVGDAVVIRDALVAGSVYRRMYSCYDSEWKSGLAHATHRVCALPAANADCAAEVTGTCVDMTSSSFPDSMCETDDGTQVVGDGDFDLCKDTHETLWKEPITVYLNAACDLVSGFGKPSLCALK